METKKCFKCGRTLPIDAFYRHPMMADGHLNKCKECAKKDVHEKYIENRKIEEYVEKERARGRDKYRRLGYSSRRSAHSENRYTRAFLLRRGIEIGLGDEVHHWDYGRPNDVFILSRSDHKYIHRFLVFDRESNLFRNNGVLLDTKEKHRVVLRKILIDRIENIPEYNFENE